MHHRWTDVEQVLGPKVLLVWLGTKQARWDAIERTRQRLLRVRALFRGPLLLVHLSCGEAEEEPTHLGCGEAKSVCKGFLELTVADEDVDDDP
jgi:hypothetical protein